MKSFSTTSFPTDHSDVLNKALMAVRKNPQALFTNFQWFLYQAKNTVYFTAFSKDSFDKEKLCDTVAQMAALAPQLTHGFIGALPGQPFPKNVLEAITSIEEVDNFDGYPDKWLDDGQDLYVDKELPLFRVRVIIRRGGADDLGRASMIMVRSSHAIMEGSDSALLTRSQHSSHGTMSNAGKKVSWRKKLYFAAAATLTLPIHMVSAHLLSPKQVEMGFSTLVFDRQRLRRVANRLGVRQRSLMFGLVLFALNNGGEGWSTEKIRGIYTMLDTERHDYDDDFFRVRSLEAVFQVSQDLEEFITKVDATIDDVEAKDITKMQFLLNTMLKAHRMISRFLPFLYSDRFFRYNGNYDMVLTMVPPHRTYGDLTKGLIEPIYCGSYHPGSNLCTFVPARKNITLNFSMRRQFLPQVDAIEGLLDQLDVEAD
ncbi:MAG: hypothetical protein L3J13_00120 [Devosiaceae bacterium]|nr:hypothetical protein [Devosiaceae bacterium]